MSRSGYTEDCVDWDLIRWRGAVLSAIRGKRGQALLRDMAAALDAMPEKRLIADDLVTPSGEVCALGQLGKVRGLPVDKLDPDDHNTLAAAFGCAPALIKEIEFINDEYLWRATPEERWAVVRRWVAESLEGEDGD